MEFISGIVLGVVLTFIGILLTEYLRNKKRKTNSINALYLEIIYNIMTAKVNYELCKDNENEKYKFFAFHTIAYENFKQEILLDENKHGKILLNLFQGYALVDMFNQKRMKLEKDFYRDDEKIFLDIEKYLKKVHDEIENKVKSVKL